MKLIIINGPPGAGKSSVAEALHQSSPPLSFLLKFDVQRRFLKNRHEYLLESEVLTYQICKAITETCLKENKDVVFERVIANTKILDEFVELGKKYNAQVFEFMLWADKDTIIHRNNIRSLPSDALPDSQRVDERTAVKYWDLINEIIDKRPKAHVIDVAENTLKEVIEKINTLIGHTLIE